MSVRNLATAAILCVSVLTGICGAAQGVEGDPFVDRVLGVFVEGGDHIAEIRDLRGETELYPEIVAALTDYAIFDHGTLLDLLLEEDGQAVAAELDRKVRTDIACLPEYISICQPNLAQRNSLILGMLWHYEEETRRGQ
jgi:hypothetical protein